MKLFFIILIFTASFVNAKSSYRCSKKRAMCQSGNGSSYRGYMNRSFDGRKCLYWRYVNHPWGILQGVEDHNYCRNPDESLMPWCYVRRGRRIVSEFCSIRKCVPTIKTTEEPSYVTTLEQRIPSSFPVDTELTCGERSEQRVSKIVGGSFIAIKSQPWVAAIFYKRQKFLCGGTLISPCWVLTAAHCFIDGDNTKLNYVSVYLGKSATNDTDVKREQNFTVEQLIIHQNFDPSNYNNDIALLKIRSSDGECAVRTPSVRTACLPPPYTQLPPGFKCNVAGFGKEAFNAPFSKLLKKADVMIVSDTDCKRGLNYRDLVTKNMLCAASPDWSTDACEGDSGGPLVCQASGRMFLFGVVSWGDGCAKKDNPGVYAQVSKYNAWIAEKTGLTEYTKGKMYPQK